MEFYVERGRRCSSEGLRYRFQTAACRRCPVELEKLASNEQVFHRPYARSIPGSARPLPQIFGILKVPKIMFLCSARHVLHLRTPTIVFRHLLRLALSAKCIKTWVSANKFFTGPMLGAYRALPARNHRSSGY